MDNSLVRGGGDEIAMGTTVFLGRGGYRASVVRHLPFPRGATVAFLSIRWEDPLATNGLGLVFILYLQLYERLI